MNLVCPIDTHNTVANILETTLPEPAQRLIAAAGPVFARHGFEKATVRQIAAQAGTNIASVNYYFGDKMGLYRAVIVAIRQQRVQQFPTPVPGEDPPAQTLRRVVHTLLSRMLAGNESGWESQLMMREMIQPTAVLDEMIQEYFRPLFECLTQTIERLRPSTTDRSVEQWRAEALVSQMAMSVVGQCVHHMICRRVVDRMIPASIRQRHYDIESLGAHITAMTLAACDHQNVVEHRIVLEQSAPSGTWNTSSVS